MKHSIGIPDWVWEFWQDKSGKKNPANYIREQLVRLTVQQQVQEALNNDTEIDFTTEPLIDFEVDDIPTLITLERMGVCYFCHKIIRKGEEAFWYTLRKGRKAVAHPDCYESQENE